MPEPLDVRGEPVVVVGAGVIGSTIAYRLAEAGAQVTIVDRSSPGSATSGSTLAGISSFGCDGPPSSAVWRSAIEEVRTLAEDLGGDWLHLDGALSWVHPGDDAALESARTQASAARACGDRIDVLAPRQVIAELEPELRIDVRVTEVYVTHDEGWLDATAMCRAAVEAATRRFAVSVVRDEVAGFDIEAGRVTGLWTANGARLSAGVVINAAGPWADEIARRAGSHLPMRPSPGGLVVTAASSARLRHLVWAPGLNLRPENGARFVIQREGHDRHLAADETARVDHPFARGAVDEAARLLPELAGVAVSELRVGRRAVPVDGEPIIGFDPNTAGLYHAVMHSGVRRSAVAARAITAELTGGSGANLAAYRPTRFSESTRLPSASGR